MVKYKQDQLIEVAPGDTVDLPEYIQRPSIVVTVDKPFYGYKKARINLVSVIMDIAKCSADSAYDILCRAGRESILGEALVTLEIPAGAKCVIGVNTNKCRCDSARVVDIRPVFWKSDNFVIVETAKEILSDQNVPFKCDPEEGGSKLRTAYTNPARGEKMKYSVGSFVKPVCDFDDNPSRACASGIHFFLHKNEAIKYVL